MRPLLLASAAVILSASTSYSQAPPAPPTIIGIRSEPRTETEQINVTGLVGRNADGSPVIRTGDREYGLPPAQYPLLLPHVDKQVMVVGTEKRSEQGQRLLVVDHIVISRERETPRR